MEPKNKLLLIFVKNPILGKVKTRLAKTIGAAAAFDVYCRLLAITERETEKLTDCTLHIYFSEEIMTERWVNRTKFVQKGDDLGARMQEAFQRGFMEGYAKIIGIGSDLPNISADIILDGFAALEREPVVFGPAEDGGYYLVGMNQFQKRIFENKPWSKSNLLAVTLAELKGRGINCWLMKKMNDIDTYEDLQQSQLALKLETTVKK